MSKFISEHPVPEGGEVLLWLCCQNCRHQKTCPYVYDQMVRCAACQGLLLAQQLNTEADRLMKAISCAECVSQLLDCNRALEHVLTRALCSETALMDTLCRQTADICESTTCYPIHEPLTE